MSFTAQDWIKENRSLFQDLLHKMVDRLREAPIGFDGFHDKSVTWVLAVRPTSLDIGRRRDFSLTGTGHAKYLQFEEMTSLGDILAALVSGAEGINHLADIHQRVWLYENPIITDEERKAFENDNVISTAALYNVVSRYQGLRQRIALVA